MNVLIKNVEKTAFQEFKAAAAKRSMRLGEAASEAMLAWAQSESAEKQRHLRHEDYKMVAEISHQILHRRVRN
jgi:hypothetical protein